LAKKRLILLIMAGLLLFGEAARAAKPDIIEPGELRAGMRGFGKTVVTGTNIETFDAEVLGVMKNSGNTGGDLILIRVSGPLMEKTGGISQGMSGSPVFFDGRLAGAVAFGWSLADPNVVMLTPIGEMLKITDSMREDLAEREQERQEQKRREDRENESRLARWRQEAEQLAMEEKKKREEAWDGYRVSEQESVALADEKKDKAAAAEGEAAPGLEENKQQTGSDDSDASAQKPGAARSSNEAADKQPDGLARNLLPRGTALMARGFSAQGLSIIRQEMKNYNFIPYEVGEAAQAMTDVRLEPGSALSIELIRGDVSLGALGTVTWVDGDEVLAFGHPFTRKGKVNYFLSNAWMFTTVSSINSSFKVGAPGEALGAALQDRGSGVAGKLGLYPVIAPMLVTVSDSDNGVHKSYAVQIIQDDLLSPYLTQAALVSLVDRTIDRTGEGTARVRFVVRARDLPDERELKRENMFYSAVNITEALAGEVASGVNLLTRNRFAPVWFTDINVFVEVTAERQTASILSARPLVKAASPGEDIGIEVTLQPYRGRRTTKVARFTVPKNQPAGALSLSVRGGISLVGLQAAVNQQKTAESALLLRYDSAKDKTLAKIIDEFNEKDRNNDIVVDILTGTAPEQNKKSRERSAYNRQEEEKRINDFVQGTKYKTNTAAPYIVTGETVTSVEITPPAGQ
jgi:hypothetical protein